MSVTNQTPINRYSANGVTTIFPYSFLIVDGGDIKVTVDGITKTLTTDYTVSGVGISGGGNVTFLSAPASGTTVVVKRNMAYKRDTDYQNNGDLLADTLNPDQDAPVLMIQQVADAVGRSIRAPDDDSASLDFGLPIAADRANKFLAFNSLGEPVVSASGNASSASEMNYIPAGAGAVATNVQTKLRESVSVKDFGAVGNGVADDTAACSAAVSYASTYGKNLTWPDGTYLTTASILGLHSVKHFGPGTIKRGSDLFCPAIQASQTNTLYIATTGNDANDGVSAAQPLLTPQGAFNALSNYGPVLDGTWRVRLAAGTYNNSATLTGLRSKNNIIIQGPSVGGHPNAPTAIIDGTGVVSNVVGWYLQFWVSASIYDVKFQNWTSLAGDAYGLNADGHCQLYLNNCHFYNCRYAGLSCDNLTQLRMQGGVVDSCTFSGVRLYSQVSASIGYNGSVVGDSTEIKNCSVGISGRISSRVHVDYCNIHNNDTGIAIEYNTRCVVNYTKTQNNNIGWLATLTADIHTSYDASNITSGNGKDYICYSSVLSATTANESNYSNYWDETSKRWLYGASAYRTPNAKYEWQMESAPSNSSYNSGVKSIFDYAGTTNYHALSGPANAYTGFCWTAPSKPDQAIIAYSMTGDYMEFWTSGATQYRMQSSQFVPLTDNNKTLGNGSFRWSTIYAGTGAINTSDARDKQDVEELTGAELRVAQSLKGLIRKFRFKDAVAEKGDKARIHVGVIAQDVKEAFEREGLDGFRYAVLCWDEWPEQPEVTDEEGKVIEPYRPAGNRYGVRYEELYSFIFGALANA